MVGDSGTSVIPALSLAPFRATPTGLVISDDVPFEVWQAYGAGIQRVGSAVPWLIGDWLNYGERRYGETYVQAIEATGMKVQLLMNYKSVARRVPISCRKESLTWTHHEIVARLPPPEQECWLARAESVDLSTKELREALRAEKGAEDPFSAAVRRLVTRLGDLLTEAPTPECYEALVTAHCVLQDALPLCEAPG